MKKFSILVTLFIFFVATGKGQVSAERIQDMKQQLGVVTNDSLKMFYLEQIAVGYRFSNMDSSVLYNDQALQLAVARGDMVKKCELLSLKGATMLETGLMAEALQLQLEALRQAEEIKADETRAIALNHIGNIYMELADYRKANDYYFQSRDIFKGTNNLVYYNELSNIGNIYTLLGKPDSALFYQQIVLDMCGKSDNRHAMVRPEVMFRMGNAYRLNKDYPKALEFYNRGIAEALFDNDIRNLTMNYNFLANLYREMNQQDSAFHNGYLAFNAASSVLFRKGRYDASLLLSELYHKKGKPDSAYHYLSIATVEKEQLMGAERIRELQRILLNEKEAQRQKEVQRIAEQNRQRQLLLLAGLGIFLLVAAILYRNNKVKQKSNRKLEKTLTDLKATQSLLIQSEKMASLGELTAGIAHEIQNPLNFVNNFSEVNTELISELVDEVEKGNTAEVKLLATDIKENSEKIKHHGKRADAIVKGMLQHSGRGSGKKEPTDINALTDEYLRLAYHGLRAKDKSFNAQLHTDFDETIGAVNIIQQDIGRVILNLITNAFYAAPLPPKGGFSDPDYRHIPTIWVSTKRIRDSVIISVRDNGPGIPEEIRDKIFQPFFTTKPTGQGTGLGLSLSYDIVKAHGGEINVETKEGGGTTFTISLPVNQ